MNERDIFVRALLLPDPAARSSFLDETCGSDAESRRRIEELLSLHESDGLMLDRPPAAFLAVLDSDATEVIGGGRTPAGAAGEGLTILSDSQPGLLDFVGVQGYEILGELGRGGMGVVYKARHLGLDRFVALKLLLSGGRASASQLARFEAEARAIARLSHPNVVGVLDFGEHDGLPFLSLEYCEGGTLAARLGGAPLPPGESARLAEVLARAVHAAHQAGIIHRDLKPANVLLAADGSLKVSDFGLARRLEDQEQTQSGVIMGTPSYMAPEQAAGQGKTLTPVADVYALGAMLYEFLTGRPPFKAATVMDTLLQVSRDEPVPPTQLVGKTPRDLETICLKCLAKEPQRRYASALDLAEDLRRFQNREPILARPVGPTGRAWRWCRRNPAVAGLLAAVLLVFAAGAILSTSLALLADRRAGEALEARGEALGEAEKARQKEAEAVTARDALREAYAELERTLARSLLRPLGQQTGPLGQPAPPLTDPEVEVLRELAGTRNEHLGGHFVREALRSPGLSRQLRGRAAYALHAAAGLNEAKRAEMDRQLRAGLAEVKDEGQRTDLALAAASWDGLSPETAAVVARILVATMCRRHDQFAVLSEALAAVSAHLEPAEAARYAGEVASHARETTQGRLANLDRTFGRFDLQAQQAQLAFEPDSVLFAMKEVSCRLDAKDAARTAESIILLLSKINRLDVVVPLVRVLRVVSGRLDTAAARKTAEEFAQAISNTDCLAAFLPDSVEVLKELSDRLDPATAGKVAAHLTGYFDSGRMFVLVRVPHRGGEQAPVGGAVQARGLIAVSDRLDAASAGKAAEALARAIGKLRDEQVVSLLDPLPEALRAVSARLDSAGASKTAEALLPLVRRSNNIRLARMGWEGLHTLGDRLDAPTAGAAAGALVLAMTSTTDADSLFRLAEALSVVTGRLDATSAARHADKAAGVLLLAMSRENNNHSALASHSRGLAAVTGRLDATSAARHADKAAAMLGGALGNVRGNNPGSARALSEGLAAVTGRLDRASAAGHAGKAAEALTRNCSETNVHILYVLAEGLKPLGDRLDARTAEKVIVSLSQPLSQTKTHGPGTANLQLASLGEALRAVGSRLDAAGARRSAEALILALESGPGSAGAEDPSPLMEGLAGAGPRLSAKDAARVADALLRMGKGGIDRNQCKGIAAVSGQLDARDAERIAGALSRDLGKGFAADRAWALTAVCARLDGSSAARHAGKAAEALTRIVDSDSGAVVPLVERLAELLGYLDEPTAARHADRTVAALVRALDRTRDVNALASLAQHLAVLSAWLDAAAAGTHAGKAAEVVVLALSKTNDPNARSTLSEGLAAILAREDNAGSSLRARGVAESVGAARCGGLIALAALRPALKPLPPPLPASELVDLLKNPLCAGEARRLILDQLQRHYGRPFADRWEFARFARERRLDLALDGPLKRFLATR